MFEWCEKLKFAKQLLETYKELLRMLDEERREHGGKDYYEKIIDAIDCIGSSITRMRARGIIDPETYRAYEEIIAREAGGG
ncbi:MAG: hypothetical protein AOA65_2221 [Candidatus Bathyarchaeota archaeon BA1]|nr:MAG: hypothetical protein AOA65_2221 [Candidatus Bathyarchaeota archaeon BA1]